MTHAERLRAAFNLQQPDRLPALGGWLAWPPTMAAIAGRTEEEYWADPLTVQLECYRRLDCDGLVQFRFPERGEFRGTTHQTIRAQESTAGPEAILDFVRGLPSPGEVERNFDLAAAYDRYAAEFHDWQAKCGDLLWCPCEFGVAPEFQWYIRFGFENYLEFVGLYPEACAELHAWAGANALNTARLAARAIREGWHPRAVFAGQDICSQRGPLVSPAFLHEAYFPHMRRSFEPLLEAGARIVWHSDGDIRPIFDDLLDCGMGGFQGFQEECGVTLDWVVSHRTRSGDPLLVYTGGHVTGTLLRTPGEVEQAVRQAIETCRGRAMLVLMTSTTVEPEVPVENILAMYETSRAL